MDFREDTLQWVKKMLLSDMIRLREVPKAIRISSTTVYATALRISNSVGCARFVQDLQILTQDIYTTSDERICAALISVLQDYININDHIGEEEFERFKSDIYPEVQRELQRTENEEHKRIITKFRR